MDIVEAGGMVESMEVQPFDSEREAEVLQRLLPIKDEQLAPDVRTQIDEIVGMQPDVVVVLAGGVKLKPGRENVEKSELTPDDYETPLFTTGTDNVGLITGARYRGIAAGIIAHATPDAVIQTNSINKNLNIRPVDVVAREVMEMGVSEERIVKEDEGRESQSTFGNVARLIEQLGRHADWKNVAIVTNDYHIERSQVTAGMVIEEAIALGVVEEGFVLDTSKLRYLREDEVTPKFVAGMRRLVARDVQLRMVACEAVITAYDPEFAKDFAAIQAMPEYRMRVSEEARGAEDFRMKRYVRSV